MPRDYLFTSESVSAGHPDKVADQISDAVLDALLTEDPAPEHLRVACETLVNTDLVVLAGEIRSQAQVDYEKIARQTIRDIGYADGAVEGFDAGDCKVMERLDRQSPDIAQGVDKDGAGDQGLMFGYACDETPEKMPLPISLAHRLMRRHEEVRKSGKLTWLRPDAKSQVSVCYEGDKPTRISTVVLSTQHDEHIGQKELEQAVIEEIIRPVLPGGMMKPEPKYLINPTGRFVSGGPAADCGLTGRKIIVDTYGGAARHGGGAFSGKDPSKVDRSAAYAMRHVAKNVVAAKLASRCEVQVAYAIGVADPVSCMVNTFGTAAKDLSDESIAKLIEDQFDLRPKAIIERLQLRRPIYRPCAAYGHFGREDLDVPWEQTDYADSLRKAAGLGS